MLKQPSQGNAVCFRRKESTLFGLLKVDALGIIKISYNRTATHFMDDRFKNLEEEVG